MTAGISVDALGTLLRERWRDDAKVVTCERGPVGNGQEVWFVEVERGIDTTSLVVRRTAESGPLDWTDREREYRLLRALESTELPTARPLFFEPDGGLLERASFAMARLPGSPFRREPQELRDRIVSDLGRLLARLHALDPGIVGDRLPASSKEATIAELRRWEAQYLARRQGSIPTMGALFGWLHANLPDRRVPPALVWGDPGPHNILHVDGEITGLLDWELWHLGDPLEDLGGAMWSVEEVADPEILITSYEEETGTEVDRVVLRWFRVLAALSRGVMLVNGIANILTDESRIPAHAGLGLHLLPATLRQAAKNAGWEPASSTPTSEGPRPSLPCDGTRPRPDAREIVVMVAAFLAGDVLPPTGTPVLRRGLKTAVALLETAALRMAIEDTVSADRASATQGVLEALASEGVDVSGGLEATAVRIETDRSLASHRPLMRRHLLADLGRQAALVRPLDELYG